MGSITAADSGCRRLSQGPASPRRWEIGYDAALRACDFVSPYTKSAGNIDAEVMVILQDWASFRTGLQPRCPAGHEIIASDFPGD